MNWFKILALAIFILCLSSFSGCDDTTTTPTVKQGYWKHTDTEIWWTAPDNDTNTWHQISEIPFNTEFRQSNDVRITYKGAECHITRYEYCPQYNDPLDSITCVWDQFPAIIDTNTEYAINYETIGSPGIGNGMGIGYPNTERCASKWGPGGNKNSGNKTIIITMKAPQTSNSPKKLYIDVNLSSGGFFYIDYFYIYEWIE